MFEQRTFADPTTVGLYPSKEVGG